MMSQQVKEVPFSLLKTGVMISTLSADDLPARVAELADALDSKSSARKGVRVRVPPLVLLK